jgi:hypothetical protein
MQRQPLSLEALVLGLVLTQVDCGNASLNGLPTTVPNKLQCLMNAAARLAYNKQKFDPVTPILRYLHRQAFTA